MKAFIFTTMVDMFGDVPFSESSLGNDDANVNQKYDDSEEIYTACLALIDSAWYICSFNFRSFGRSNLWWQYSCGRAANSLKLKVLMNARYSPSFTAELAYQTKLIFCLLMQIIS